MEAQPLWEYPCYALHTPLLLATLDLSQDLWSLQLRHEGSVSLDLDALRLCAEAVLQLRHDYAPGTAPASAAAHASSEVPTSALHYNGVAVWANWRYGDGEEQLTELCTGPVEAVGLGKQVKHTPLQKTIFL